MFSDAGPQNSCIGMLEGIPGLNGYDSVTNAAADTLKGMIRKLSSGDVGLPPESCLESTDNAQIPGLWINRIWERKDVEELDRVICSALRDEGLDPGDYFKRYVNKCNSMHVLGKIYWYVTTQ